MFVSISYYLYCCSSFIDLMEDYNHATMYYYNWLMKESKSIDDAFHLISLYKSVLSDMSNYLVGSIAKFDIFLIIVSIVLSIQVST